MDFLYVLEPITANKHSDALNIGLKYFDRMFGTDCLDHEKLLIAEYDYNDTHGYPKAVNKNAFVYLIKGSPNRGLAIVRDIQRYYSISVDSLEHQARIYVLKDSEMISDFRTLAYKSFLIVPRPFMFKAFKKSFNYGNQRIELDVGPVYTTIKLPSEGLDIRAIEQWWPIDLKKKDNKLVVSIPTFSVPFAIFDLLHMSEKNLLATLIREIYGP